jgi:hypothetical protein
MRLLISTLAIIGLILCSAAQAKGSGGGGRGTSVGKSSTKGGYRSSASSRRMEHRRSLLERAPSQPSAKVAQVIRERESSGPGWVGTAFLVALLSRHDLSSADRHWIQGRIDALRAEGDEEDYLLDATTTSVTFDFKGLVPKLVVGDLFVVMVGAKRKGAPVPVTCSLEEASVTRAGLLTKVSWEPSEPGSRLLTCEAAGHQSRRLLRVAPAGDKSPGWR